MPVDFNPMLFNYPIRENLARFFGFKVGLGGWPQVLGVSGDYAQLTINQGLIEKRGCSSAVRAGDS